MSEGDLSARANHLGADEIGQLASQFNAMADAVQGSFEEVARERDALRRFVADASHQLRTPITALSTFNTLLQSPAGLDEATREEFLSESRDQIDRLDWITKNLLDLSRLDAGIADLNLERRDVGDLVASVRSAFAARASGLGIDIRVERPEPEVAVAIDVGRLELALANLVDNALRATPRGGKVTLRVAELDGGVAIDVRDTGPGIPEGHRELIFQRFYRGPETAWPGSGLGLAIARSIVESHRGRLEAVEPEGEGAQLRVWLPTGPAPPPPSAPSPTRLRR
jgi:two-component system sensor histidine kinase MtrB